MKTKLVDIHKILMADKVFIIFKESSRHLKSTEVYNLQGFILKNESYVQFHNKLPPDLSNMFQYSYNYITRNKSNQGLFPR